MTNVDIETWTDVALECTRELAVDLLGLDGFEIVCRNRGLSPSVQGAFLPLIRDDSSLHVGIFSDADAIRRLACALLQVEEQDEEPDGSEVADAVGEITNVLAGAVKTRLEDAAPDTELGLPLFTGGEVSFGHGARASIIDLDLGGIPVTLLVALVVRDDVGS